MSKVLIIDDDFYIHKLINLELERQGCDGKDVIHAYSGIEGIENYILHKPKLVLLDMIMPEMDGFETYTLIRDHDCDAKVLLMTGYNADAGSHAAISLGIDGYISKNKSGYVKMVVSIITSTLEC